MNQVRLSALQPGSSGVIAALELVPEKARRLQELGLFPGASVTCCYAAPSGSPIAFQIKQASIALRRRDCTQIVVTPHA